MNHIVLDYIWIIIQIIIGYNLILPIVLFLLFKVFGSSRNIHHSADPVEADYAIIVTAYEQVDLLNDVINSILRLNYSNYIIYVIADNCDISGLSFDDNRVVLIRPTEVLANNIRSHFYAIEHFKRDHERLTIIDSDNIVESDYLKNLNAHFNKGYKAVQGIRKSKNLNTIYACLDAARDLYYHYYDGKLMFALGSSATLAGSGMAFTTDLYKDCLSTVSIEGAGFDKVLQFEIVKRGLRIAFCEMAIVYDEKTSESEQLVKQRSRWISTWLKYFNYGFTLIGRGIRQFNLNQFLFGITLLRPPLFISLILSVICFVVNIWISQLVTAIWAFALVIFLAGFLIPLTTSGVDSRIKRSLIHFPKFMYYQVIALVNIKSTSKGSIATKHSFSSEIKDIN